MVGKKYMEVAAGTALLLLGLWIAAYSVQYRLGSLNDMKPGFFPFSVGILIVPCALLIIFNSLGLSGKAQSFDWKAVIVVLGSILIFAIAMPLFGLFPTVFLMVAFFGLGSSASGPLETAVTAIALAVLTCLVFVIGLGLPIRIARWDVF